MFFTTIFFKLGYLGIEIIMDKAKVNYSRVSVVQASDQRERLEYLEIKRDGVAISSVDAVNMYPSIQLTTIRTAVIFSQGNLLQQPRRSSTFS